MNEAITYNNYKRIGLKRRRVAILKKRILISILTILFIAVGVLIGSNLSSVFRNNAENTQNIYKYYTSIQVEAGDNLWNIAGRYATAEYSDRNAYVEELIAVNKLSDATIHAGQYLTVPYYSYAYK